MYDCVLTAHNVRAVSEALKTMLLAVAVSAIAFLNFPFTVEFLRKLLRKDTGLSMC